MDDKQQYYLGDGVYAEFDGYQIWVFTQAGHRIALEPPVLDRLAWYAEKVFNQGRSE